MVYFKAGARMSEFPFPAAWRRERAFLLVHALSWPLACIALATWLRHSGLDERLSAWWYDAQAQRFPARNWPWLELLGHRGAKSVLLAGWGLLLAAALAAPWVPALAKHRQVLWLTVLAMGLGPALVAGMKDINTHACPWDLKVFGGSADYSARWFVGRSEAGRCFPAGHAAGGFSLVALMFAGRAIGHRGLARWGLVAALLTGGLFTLVRTMQGAHFVSHSLWSAAIDWWVAGLFFWPLLLRRGSIAPHAKAAAAARLNSSASHP